MVSGPSCLTHRDCAPPPHYIKLPSCLWSAYSLPVIVSWRCIPLALWLSAFHSWCIITVLRPPSAAAGCSRLVGITDTLFCLCLSRWCPFCPTPQPWNLSLFHSQNPVFATAVLRAYSPRHVKILDLQAAHFPTFCLSTGTDGKITSGTSHEQGCLRLCPSSACTERSICVSGPVPL